MEKRFRLDGVFVRDLSDDPTEIILVCKDCLKKDERKHEYFIITQKQEFSGEQPLPKRECLECFSLIEWEKITDIRFEELK